MTPIVIINVLRASSAMHFVSHSHALLAMKSNRPLNQASKVIPQLHRSLDIHDTSRVGYVRLAADAHNSFCLARLLLLGAPG